MKHLTPSKVHTINGIASILGAIIMWCGAIFNAAAPGVIGIIIMLGSLVFRFIFHKCPHCGEYLGRGVPKYCRHCGEEISR